MALNCNTDQEELITLVEHFMQWLQNIHIPQHMKCS